MALTSTMAYPTALPTVMFQFFDKEEPIVDVFKLDPNIYNYSSWRLALRNLMQDCKELYPDFDLFHDFLFTNFYACNGIANEHLREFNIGGISNDNFINFYNTFGCIYSYSTPVFGIIGLVPTILTMCLIGRNKSLHTSYGIIAFAQALVMSALLFEHSTLESYYLIKQVCIRGTRTEVTVGLDLFGGRIDRYMIYVNYSLTISAAFLRLLKTINRVVGLYMPFRYAEFFSNSNTRLICLTFILACLISFLPLIITPALCDTIILFEGRYDRTICSKTLSLFYLIIRTCVALVGFFLGILLIFKFRVMIKRNVWTSLKKQQEKILILQTFCDFVDFIVMFGPLFLFRLLYSNLDWVANLVPYLYVFNLTAHRPQGVACLGHGIDSLITLILLYRLVQLDRRIGLMVAPQLSTAAPNITVM